MGTEVQGISKEGPNQHADAKIGEMISRDGNLRVFLPPWLDTSIATTATIEV